MKRNHRLLILILMALLLASLVGTAAMAQAPSNYRVAWYTISRGGGYSYSDNYGLDGSAAQLIGHTQAPSSDNYAVRRGPWERILPFRYRVYLPVVLRH